MYIYMQQQARRQNTSKTRIKNNSSKKTRSKKIGRGGKSD